MKLTIAFIMLLFVGLSVAVGQTTDKTSSRNSQTEQELLKLNQAYDEALVRGDAAALDRIYADEFVYTTFDGTVRDKTQQLTFTKSGDLRLESGQSDDVKIRVYKNVAVMTGRFTAKGQFKGKNIDVRERYTAVWVKKDGRWRLVAEQGNEIKQQQEMKLSNNKLIKVELRGEVAAQQISYERSSQAQSLTCPPRVRFFCLLRQG